MIDRTLKCLAALALLTVAACADTATQTSNAEASPPDMTGWRMASGKPPTKAEFAALAATCRAKGGAIDACLGELGLKRAP